MNYNSLLSQLRADALRIQALASDVPRGQATWKPDPASWSILEVVNHLYDEEREDFRVRLDIILHDPERPWPPIDPQGWVISRAYNERDLEESLEGFLRERQESLIWLDGLEGLEWDKSVTAPFGVMTAGDMFASWVAHDLLHMRQLVELHRGYVLSQAGSFDSRYAGEW